MSSTWNGIHQHLMHASSGLGFKRTFDHLRQRHASLTPFADPVALLDALHYGSDTPEQKNTILRILVEVVQSGGLVADSGLTLMLLSLWPGLNAIRRRSLWRKLAAPDEIASDILARTIEAVHGLDLRRVRRIAATILKNIERDLGRDHAREAKRQSLRVELDVDQIVGGSREPLVSKELLKRDIARLVGDDARLVLRVAVDGFSQVEVAAELGLTEAAARKRYQRAIRRLRQDYSDPMSRSGALLGFSRAGAVAPSRETDGAGLMNCTDDNDDLTRVPGLFRRWELSDVLKTRRTYRLEEAGIHADGTPLMAIYTSTAGPQQAAVSADDAMPDERSS